MTDVFGYPIEPGSLVTAPLGDGHSVAGEVTETDMFLNRITIKSHNLTGHPHFVVPTTGAVAVDGFRGQ